MTAHRLLSAFLALTILACLLRHVWLEWKHADGEKRALYVVATIFVFLVAFTISLRALSTAP